LFFLVVFPFVPQLGVQLVTCEAPPIVIHL
jgi:hypothetical protein